MTVPVAASAPPAWRSLSTASYLGAASGLTGGAVGWAASQSLISLGRIINSYGPLDLVVLTLLGAGIGGMVGAATASLRDESRPRAIGLGLLRAAGGSAAGGLIAFLIVGIGGFDRSPTGFVAARVLVWVAAGAGMGAAMASGAAAGGRIRIGRAVAAGMMGGLLGAALLSVPGPAAVWQLVGFMVIGAFVGFSCIAAEPGSWVVERLPPPGAAVGLWRHREWEIGEGRPASVGGQLRIESVGGQGRATPIVAAGLPMTIGGRTIRAAAAVQPGDRIRVGDQEFLVRRTRGAR
jgi:hypothetical protein